MGAPASNRVREHRVARELWLTLVLATSAGCEGSSSTPGAADLRARGAEPPERELVVFAATSLRDVFTLLGDDYERSHPGVEVTFSFAGTQELHTQLDHDASADVFASADRRHMDELLAAGRMRDPVVFARNEPVLVVSEESAGTLRTLADLPSATHIVIGAPEVPIGRYTLEILDRASASSLGADFRARVESHVVSRELNVRQVLARVSLGEAEAGIVYRTDTRGAERVSVVTLPPEVNVIAEYPIAVVSDAEHPRLAQAWVELVLGPRGRGALSDAGFILPAGGSPSP